MIAFAIFGGWTFLVTLACLVGTNKELAEEQTTTCKLRVSLNSVQKEKELAREKAKMLLQYVDSDREYRAFDDILRGLPKGSYRGHTHQHRIMEAQQFDYAAFNAVSEPCADSMTLTVLAFDAMQLHFYGREYTGWERGGWVMVPKEALSR
ncbi:MAG TPA: hypothetical protein VI298_08635 [Geobacteraceae bacterium]